MNVKSIYDQLTDILIENGYCLIKCNNIKKPVFYSRKFNQLEQLDEDKLKIECRKMLMIYLNQEILDQLTKSGDKFIKIGSITVSLTELKIAEKNGFLLFRETNKLIEILKLSPLFIKNESDFKPESKQIPIKNGIITFDKLGFKFSEYDGKKVFISQINACYNKSEGLI